MPHGKIFSVKFLILTRGGTLTLYSIGDSSIMDKNMHFKILTPRMVFVSMMRQERGVFSSVHMLILLKPTWALISGQLFGNVKKQKNIHFVDEWQWPFTNWIPKCIRFKKNGFGFISARIQLTGHQCISSSLCLKGYPVATFWISYAYARHSTEGYACWRLIPSYLLDESLGFGIKRRSCTIFQAKMVRKYRKVTSLILKAINGNWTLKFNLLNFEVCFTWAIKSIRQFVSISMLTRGHLLW